MLQRALIIFCLLLLKDTSFAQLYALDDFVNYTIKDGLSDNYVNSIQQDEHGYLWIGTDAGLNRFDGHAFNSYTQGSKDVPLFSGKIFRLKMFDGNRLAIISRGGFQLLNAQNFTLQNFLIADSTPFSTFLNTAWDAYQMPDRSVAISTASGFYTFTQDGQLNFRYDAYSQQDIGKKTIRYGKDIIPVNKEEYLVYVEDLHLAYYNSKERSFRELDPSDKRWGIYYKPPATVDDIWILKQQFAPAEHLFIQAEGNTITYFNQAKNTTVTSSLPFNSRKEISYESKITMLDDTSFVINAANEGFFRLSINRNTGKVNCLPEKFLPTLKINCLFRDKSNRLWAGTPQGLMQQKLHKPFLETFSVSPAAFDNDLTGHFNGFLPYKNKIYVCRYSNHVGLAIFDSTMKLEKSISFFNKEKKWNEIHSIQVYHPDTLWLSTNSGVIWLDTKTYHYGKIPEFSKYQHPSGENLMLAPADKNGYAWFCYMHLGVAGRYHIPTRTFTFYTSETTPAIPFNNLKHIRYDSYGDVWIGGHSLTRWNNQLGFFDTLITVYAGAKKFNDNILCMSSGEDGTLWIHNEENGLLEYFIREKRFVQYSTRDGLPTNSLESFSPVTNGILWIAGMGHLAGFDTRTKKTIVYSYRDGFPMQKLTSRIIFHDSLRHHLYMLFKHSLVRFQSTPFAAPDHSSKLLVQELVVNNKRSIFHPEEEMRFRTEENNLIIKCGIIDFETTSEYNFSYKLTRAGTWTSLGQERNITLTNLPPGRYILDIKAIGKMGDEKTTQMNFYIAPPFWKTGWFVILLLLLLWAGLLLLYRNRIRSIRQKANIDKLLVQTEMKALHTQMNPHFIFNSLNSIREMILNKENNEASHYLSKFAHLMRITLDQSEQTFVTLQSTIDYLERYIEMEKIRNTNFSFTISVDETLPPDTLLPPMLIQPFIENAIWHGTGGKRQDIHIKIGFKNLGDSFVCTVDDNGIGIDQSIQLKDGGHNNHHSVGIANIRNRIRLLNEKYKLQCSVTIEDKAKLPGSNEPGTLVTLKLPLEMPEE